MRKRLTVSRGLVLYVSNDDFEENYGPLSEGWTFRWILRPIFEIKTGMAYEPQNIATRYRPARIKSVTPNGVIVRIILSTRTYVRYHS